MEAWRRWVWRKGRRKGDIGDAEKLVGWEDCRVLRERNLEAIVYAPEAIEEVDSREREGHGHRLLELP